MKQKMVS